MGECPQTVPGVGEPAEEMRRNEYTVQHQALKDDQSSLSNEKRQLYPRGIIRGRSRSYRSIVPRIDGYLRDCHDDALKIYDTTRDRKYAKMARTYSNERTMLRLTYPEPELKNVLPPIPATGVFETLDGLDEGDPSYWEKLNAIPLESVDKPEILQAQSNEQLAKALVKVERTIKSFSGIADSPKELGEKTAGIAERHVYPEHASTEQPDGKTPGVSLTNLLWAPNSKNEETDSSLLGRLTRFEGTLAWEATTRIALFLAVLIAVLLAAEIGGYLVLQHTGALANPSAGVNGVNTALILGPIAAILIMFLIGEILLRKLHRIYHNAIHSLWSSTVVRFGAYASCFIIFNIVFLAVIIAGGIFRGNQGLFLGFTGAALASLLSSIVAIIVVAGMMAYKMRNPAHSSRWAEVSTTALYVILSGMLTAASSPGTAMSAGLLNALLSGPWVSVSGSIISQIPVVFWAGLALGILIIIVLVAEAGPHRQRNRMHRLQVAQAVLDHLPADDKNLDNDKNKIAFKIDLGEKKSAAIVQEVIDSLWGDEKTDSPYAIFVHTPDGAGKGSVTCILTETDSENCHYAIELKSTGIVIVGPPPQSPHQAEWTYKDWEIDELRTREGWVAKLARTIKSGSHMVCPLHAVEGVPISVASNVQDQYSKLAELVVSDGSEVRTKLLACGWHKAIPRNRSKCTHYLGKGQFHFPDSSDNVRDADLIIILAWLIECEIDASQWGNNLDYWVGQMLTSVSSAGPIMELGNASALPKGEEFIAAWIVANWRIVKSKDLQEVIHYRASHNIASMSAL